MKVFLVTILPVKYSKESYVLGAFDSAEKAISAAKTETNKPDASWWTTYTIDELEVR